MVEADKPELANGFTRIANTVLENLATVRLNGREWNVLMVIFRYTYGWHRKEARISLGQFAASTGLLPKVVSGIIQSLEGKGIICVGRENRTRTYSFQKYLTRWQAEVRAKPYRMAEAIPVNGDNSHVPENGDSIVPENMDKVIHENGDKVVPENGDTGKDRKYSKDSTKDNPSRTSAKPPAPPGVQELFATYFEEYQKAHGRKPAIRGGQDGKLLKTLLTQHSLEELQRWLVFYVNSDEPFYRKVGWTIGIFYSQINGIIIAYEGNNGNRGSTSTIPAKETAEQRRQREHAEDMERKFGGLGEKW